MAGPRMADSAQQPLTGRLVQLKSFLQNIIPRQIDMADNP